MFAEFKRLQFQKQCHRKNPLDFFMWSKVTDAANTQISFNARDQRRTKTFARLSKTSTLTVDPNQKVMWRR